MIGSEQSVLFAIQNLMDRMDWFAEQAMQALKIPESEQTAYFECVIKNNNNYYQINNAVMRKLITALLIANKLFIKITFAKEGVRL